MKRRSLLAALAGALWATAAAADLKAGQPAPDFTGTTPQGKKVTLSGFRGKSVVLLNFYANF